MANKRASPATSTLWLKALNELADLVTTWSEDRGWLVQRGEKTLRDEASGEYAVPVLTIQTDQGRLRLDPVALDIVGATGRVDLYAWPSLVQVMLTDFDKGWHVFDDEGVMIAATLNEAVFATLADSLSAAAA